MHEKTEEMHGQKCNSPEYDSGYMTAKSSAKVGISVQY